MSKLILEVGKAYVNGRNEVRIIKKETEDNIYPYADEQDEIYTKNGQWEIAFPSLRDLVQEATITETSESELTNTMDTEEPDLINHPLHYNSLPVFCECGKPIECIQVKEVLPSNLGDVIKYVWRADFKGNKLKDLQKAAWYLKREIERVKQAERGGE